MGNYILINFELSFFSSNACFYSLHLITNNDPHFTQIQLEFKSTEIQKFKEEIVFYVLCYVNLNAKLRHLSL